MKKTITLVLASCGIIISHAQITITSADVLSVGKLLYQAQDTIHETTKGIINPGLAGANKTWDFSATLASGTVDTIITTNPAWLPNGSNFPTSNIVATFPDGTEYYLRNSSTGLYTVGAYSDFGGGPMNIKFIPNEELTSFPNTYNSSFQNTSAFDLKLPYTGGGSLVDSARFKETKSKNIKTDGWGTVKTPLGSYSSIRQRGKVVTNDSIWLHNTITHQWSFFQESSDSVYHFAWWANGLGLPLLEFDSTEADTIRNISWLKSAPVAGAVHENSAFSGLNTYPNPSAGIFNVALPSTVSNGTAEIYTLRGEKVLTSSVAGGKESSVDLSKQPAGVYFLRITSKEGTITRKLVVSR